MGIRVGIRVAGRHLQGAKSKEQRSKVKGATVKGAKVPSSLTPAHELQILDTLDGRCDILDATHWMPTLNLLAGRENREGLRDNQAAAQPRHASPGFGPTDHQPTSTYMQSQP